jgi:hypothetical protein
VSLSTSRSRTEKATERKCVACVVCGASLVAHRPHARHCSGACRAEASRIKAILAGNYSGKYVSLAGRFQALRTPFVRLYGAPAMSPRRVRAHQLKFEGENWL